MKIPWCAVVLRQSKHQIKAENSIKSFFFHVFAGGTLRKQTPFTTPMRSTMGQDQLQNSQDGTITQLRLEIMPFPSISFQKLSRNFTWIR